MNEREKIFGRIREGLRLPAPRPGHGPDGLEINPGQTHPSAEARRWLPLVGDSFDERLTLFQKNCADLKTEFYLANGREDFAAKLRELREREKWSRIGVHKGELTDFACGEMKLPACRTDKPYETNELESCSVGITECDALVAQTGSVLVTSHSAGGRALSVLPPHHLVLARPEQLLPDLPAAFALLKQKYSTSYPSFISLITGPSRTSDIERILVLGAHGPRKLTVLVLRAGVGGVTR